MQEQVIQWIEQLQKAGQLPEEAYGALIQYRSQESLEELKKRAQKIVLDKGKQEISVCGTISLSNYCKNDCAYCGIRRENRFLNRFRMDEKDVLELCQKGWERGISSFLIQGGEDLQYSYGEIAHMITGIKAKYSKSRVTLSLGEKSGTVYEQWKRAGADGYILCHETARDSHYRKLHPANMSLLRRKQCLWELKEIGYQVGTGMMVGSPNQRIDDLAADLVFLRQLMPDYIQVYPFIPAQGTEYENERSGNVELVCYLISMLRIMFPDATIPVAQGVALLDKSGMVRAVKSGADMILPDMTGEPAFSLYHNYQKRLMRGKIGLESVAVLRLQLQETEYEIITGDR